MSAGAADVPVGPPPNPRATRQRYLVTALRLLSVVALVGAGLRLVGQGDLARVGEAAVLVALIGAPAGRVGWLAVRWTARRDLRFAAVAAALLGVMAGGYLLGGG